MAEIDAAFVTLFTINTDASRRHVLLPTLHADSLTYNKKRSFYNMTPALLNAAFLLRIE
jgi:hypothetical protein